MKLQFMYPFKNIEWLKFALTKFYKTHASVSDLLTELADNDAKGVVEGYHAVKLPRKRRQIVALQIEDSDKAKRYGYDAEARKQDLESLGPIAQGLTTVRVFLKLIKFSKPQAAGVTQDSTGATLAGKKSDFESVIKEMANKRPGRTAALKAAIGCTGECFFCGARCTALL